MTKKKVAHLDGYSAPKGLLYRLTLERLRRDFEERGHRPSKAQWEALEDLVLTLERITHGDTQAKVFLSSLDPGIGKTTTLIRFIDTLLSVPSEPLASVGVLVCINTKSEIKALVEQAGIPAEMLCVWTGDAKLNALGKANADDARVLIVTHARMDKVLAGTHSDNAQGHGKATPFWACRPLYYKGAPRQLRVWDEALLMGQPISLNVDDVYYLLRSLKSISIELRNDVKHIFDGIEKADDNSLFRVPHFMQKHELWLEDLLDALPGDEDLRDEAQARVSEEQRRILLHLNAISGKPVRVRKDGYLHTAAVDYMETIPADLAPIVVLDASGRVRRTYEGMEKGRGSLVRLKSAPKSYRNLTINVWRRSGGKSAWKDQGSCFKLIDGICATIQSRRDEDWLVVHHKRGTNRHFPDIPELILNELADDESLQSRVKFITWGRHRGVNEYRHCPNIILAGMLYLRDSQYEALNRLSLGLRPEKGVIERSELADFQLGEHADNILQALCRGAVRKSLNDTCPPCRAYVIASARSGIAEALQGDVFPECKLQTWSPLKVELKGVAADVFRHLQMLAVQAKPGDVISFTKVYQKLGIHRAHFKRDVRDNPQFKAEVSNLGLFEWGPNVKFTGWKMGDQLPASSSITPATSTINF